MITVDEYPLGMNIVYDIRAGTRDEVYNYLENLEHRYHPAGYGTRLEWIEVNTVTGLYHARITRSQSCD
jgi:hypothetical protein